jgi:alcohol dehydrogenase
MKLNTTVAPFILRGASLLGIDSGYIGFPKRQQVWDRLATDLKPQKLAGLTREIALADLPAVFPEFLAAHVKGRTVVRVGGES